MTASIKWPRKEKAITAQNGVKTLICITLLLIKQVATRHSAEGIVAENTVVPHAAANECIVMKDNLQMQLTGNGRLKIFFGVP